MAYRKRAYRKKRSYRPRRRTFRRSYKKAYRKRYVYAAPQRRYEETPKPSYIDMAGDSAVRSFGAKLGNVLGSAAGTSAVLLLGQGRRLLSSLL